MNSPRNIKEKELLLREYLVEVRKGSDLTQEELAKKLNKPQSFVSKYESGERRLDVLELFEILESLDLDLPKAMRELTRRLELT